jgi:hypothetical protein
MYLILLSLFLVGCAGNKPDNKSAKVNVSELDLAKYQRIDIEKFDNESTSCGMDKLLQCLDVSESTCHKIYRAAAVDCFDKFYKTNGTGADLCSPSNKGYIDSCMLLNVLKHGKGGMSQAMQCMEST